jgi:hypothetical protein
MCAHKNSNGPYASFYALVKDFLEFDSIQPIRRSVGKDQCCKKSRSHGLTLTSARLRQFYEEKGA